MNKERKIDLIGFCLLGMTLLILGSALFFLLNWAMAWDNQVHENKMEELLLEKEIALIDQNTSYEKEINIKDSYENLRGLNNCLYYEEATNTFYKSVCYLIDREGEIYR